MKAEQIIERAVQRAEGAQATISRSESVPISFESGRLKTIKTTYSIHMDLRVIVDGKLGSSHTTDENDADGLVDRAVEAAAFGRPVTFSFPSPEVAPAVEIYDPAVVSCSKEEMVAIGEEMVAMVQAYDPHVVVYADVNRTLSQVDFANSSGMQFLAEGTQLSVGVYGNRVRGTDILWAGDGFGWRRRDVDHRKIASRAIERFRLAEHLARVVSGNTPVLFTPMGMSVLIMALREGFNGENVLLGSSPLTGKVGEQVFSEKFSLTDDGTVDYASASGRYDGEGVPHRRLPLVEQGVVRHVLYDLDIASKAGLQSTGHGPGCGPTNWVIEEGVTSYGDLIASVDEGIIVEQAMGLGQGNVMAGEFSVNVSLGYKIEKGEIVGRVKEVMLTGNGYDALRHVGAVGDEAEWTWGAVKTPPILIERLSVVAK